MLQIQVGEQFRQESVDRAQQRNSRKPTGTLLPPTLRSVVYSQTLHILTRLFSLIQVFLKTVPFNTLLKITQNNQGLKENGWVENIPHHLFFSQV